MDSDYDDCDFAAAVLGIKEAIARIGNYTLALDATLSALSERAREVGREDLTGAAMTMFACGLLPEDQKQKMALEIEKLFTIPSVQ